MPFFEPLARLSDSLGEGAAHTLKNREGIKQKRLKVKLKLEIGKGDRRMAKVELEASPVPQATSI
jgi:hypothetical protein